MKSAIGVAIIGALEDALHDPDDVVRFTVGRFEAEPGAPSTVPGRVVFTIDLRHPDAATIERLAATIETTCATVGQDCAIAVRQTMVAAPTIFPDDIVDDIRRQAAALGLANMDMPSGAGHDAMNLHDLCPTGMIFIPCKDGISHNEAESATPEDCAAGARVLAACLTDLANR